MSATRHRRYSGLSTSDALWVSKNVNRLETLPEPGTEWTASEAGIDCSLESLQAMGVIEAAGYSGVDERVKAYKTTEKGFDAVSRFLEERDESDSVFPCCGSNIQNERGVDGITCGDCGTVYDRGDLNL